MKQELQILESVIDVAVQRGLFRTSSDVVKVNDALKAITQKLNDQYDEIENLNTTIKGLKDGLP